MNGRRLPKSRNSELPIPANEPEANSSEARIELAPPPEIDISQDKIGALFTERRRAMGLKIEEIADDIKLKADYLRAIEQERWDQLPTPEYARLFIKAYAERLGFNLSEVFALLDVSATLTPAVPKPKVPALAAEPARRSAYPEFPPSSQQQTTRGPIVVWGTVGIIVIAVGIVVVVAIMGGKSKPKDASSAAQNTAALAVPTPVPAPDQAEDTLPVETIPETVEPMNLSLQFSVETWVFLEADHDTVFSGVIKAGEKLDASAVESIVMSLGHTNGVAATLNGKTIGPTSTWGRRLNHFMITQDSAHAWLRDVSTGSGGQSGATQRTTTDTGIVR